MLHDDVQVISVDDHVIEHERVWLDRLPAKYRDVGPHIVELDGGTQVWKFEDRIIPTIGLNAVAGKDPKDYGVDPVSFDEMLPGCYDVTARLADITSACRQIASQWDSIEPRPSIFRKDDD